MSVDVANQDGHFTQLRIQDGEVVIIVPQIEWERLREKVNTSFTILNAVMAALAASPFGGSIPQEIRDELDRVNAI